MKKQKGKTAGKKEPAAKTAFTQSVQFDDPTEQHYYTAARQMLKDHGVGTMLQFIDELRNGKREFPPDLGIAPPRFFEILDLAHKDYMDLLFGKLFPKP